jgi:hypothetical protein
MTILGRPANDDMVEGYMDGFRDDRLEYPDSLSNRSRSYRHGWLNGRDDRVGEPRLAAKTIRELADIAMALDDAERI